MLLGLWAYGTWILWIVERLASLDEEWQGWADVLLNPYIVGPYVVASAVLLIPAVMLLSRRDGAAGAKGSRSGAHG